MKTQKPGIAVPAQCECEDAAATYESMREAGAKKERQRGQRRNHSPPRAMRGSRNTNGGEYWASVRGSRNSGTGYTLASLRNAEVQGEGRFGSVRRGLQGAA